MYAGAAVSAVSLITSLACLGYLAGSTDAIGAAHLSLPGMGSCSAGHCRAAEVYTFIAAGAVVPGVVVIALWWPGTPAATASRKSSLRRSLTDGSPGPWMSPVADAGSDQRLAAGRGSPRRASLLRGVREVNLHTLTGIRAGLRTTARADDRA
jgi:hypothetical protein